MRARAALTRCCAVLLLSPLALAVAQTPTSVPKRPGNDTLVVKPRQPPPNDEPCVPGAVCPPRDRPDGPGSDALPDRDASREPSAPDASRETAPPGPVATPGARSGIDAPSSPIPTAPDRVRELLVASADVAESEMQRAWFAQQGVGVLRRRVLVNLGWVLTVYRVPPATDLPGLLGAFSAQWPNAMPEANERYRPLSAAASNAGQYATRLIGMPPAGCARQLRLAMLDGPVNPGIPGFASRVRSVDIAGRGAAPDYAHGTGIAALWLGAGEVQGLLPGAELLAINVFAQRGRESYTTTEWILRGLDLVLGETPMPVVVNLSFGGPQSAQLARALQRVQQRTRVVAAAGNDGESRPIYPAAYPGVIAVTAVDARRRRWTRANAGEYIALAAPGVDVWTVDGEGRGYYASGTSFAAVYVTAAVALATPPPASLPTWLSAHAEDLGAPGRDRLFGFGLLRAEGLCPAG